ncbi:N-6 DNA methylase [Alteromonas sp. 5E99-2]|uniref:Eco57I restriction-modification methylase domain-containing protein n=1 Tax=Alteromonas sp. 5E99-2 TaxID=2817683 RepID=UPI001A98489E|nr:N-6 DNA methylase [Alteromonas sp. 5E99-2]MBO1254890.1 N-6 DNA methylase [Alteromonas sp. 5E99-2]
MRQPLDKALRKKLEDTVIRARDIVEAAVKENLQRLGVADSQAPSYLKDNEKVLRNKLRAHARQLGDRLSDGKQEVTRLTNEMAYEHWHRMLFARFLEQSNLLMYDPQTPVTLDECFELAEEEDDCKDGWELAGRLAQKMLPQIFRADSPVFEVKLSMNRVDELESLISKLDPQTYQAQDSLGWSYQFWQTKKKEEVNKSGVRIGAQELSPVTQLFTEPYMVSFLLDNALGAWWANERLTRDDLTRANNEQELRELASIPGVSLEYLRFSKKEEGSEQWQPAAGTFEKWPEHLSELKTLDPCCGSGHFLVAIFLMLVPMRVELEGLTEKQAIDAVLRDNIHGLELDQRCVELAAFALALEAWRYPNAGGYRQLPELQLACSGMSIAEAQKEWKDLAKGDEALTDAISWMQMTFKEAQTLGSLIEPVNALEENQNPPWMLLENSFLKRNEASSEAKAAAKGLAIAADLLSNKYQWVLTNVPYLANNKFDDELKDFSNEFYPNSKADLANIFIDRILKLLTDSGHSQLVTPQNWLFLSSFRKQREELLTKNTIKFLARLGTRAFDTISGEVVNVILTAIDKSSSETESNLVGVDVSIDKTASDKANSLRQTQIFKVEHKVLIESSGSKINFESQSDIEELSNNATSNLGICSGDYPRFGRTYWECSFHDQAWARQSTSTKQTSHYGGGSNIFLWEKGNGQFLSFLKERLGEGGIYSWLRGEKAWGKKGVIVSATGALPVTLYGGELFDNNVSVLIPNDPSLIPALWCFCASGEFTTEVRLRNQQLKITDQSFVEIPCDLNAWKKVAADKYPNGLPLPYSNDSTQLIFHGHPCASVIWGEESRTTSADKLRQDDTVLQVTVARLLSYQWPAELDPEMELAPEMREVMKKNADFADLVDDDGIVCIPAVRGEKSAAKRLEAMLLKAYGDAWDSSVETSLLKTVKAKDLESWLRDKFFEQHCKLFQHRPFIWHIWDGLKDGFSALVNYHQLDHKGLERLIYTYLDDWISNQKRQLVEGSDGADIRLTAAENLKIQLEAILEGEEGLDIFVRWKSLEEQPIGWNPDLNDGVRLNIRPFMLSKDVGKKGAGVLRAKPNIHWKKDRGTDVESAPWFNLGLEYGGKQGDRINEHHLSLAVKRAAKEAKE